MSKFFGVKTITGFLLVLVVVMGFASKATAQASPFYYPVGVPRCQFVNPISSASHYLQYPLPANYSTTVTDSFRVKTIPDSYPVKEFKLEWAAVIDRADQITRYDFLSPTDGYTATLSSDAASDGIQPINQVVSLVGSLNTTIKNSPIKYTLTLRKNGSQVATCSVSVKHSVSWIEIYDVPETAQPTGNSAFPFKVKDILGTPYVTKPLPAAGSYPLPLKTFVGRYYDFASTGGRFFDWNRTMGYWPGFSATGQIEENSSRLLMPMAASILGWNKADFISRLKSEPLLFFKGNTFIGEYFDAFIPWNTALQLDPTRSDYFLMYDEPCRLKVNSMDVDDRGFIYFTNQTCAGGVFIAKDDGSKLSAASQILSPEWFSSSRSFKIKSVNAGIDIENEPIKLFKAGSKYYLFQEKGGIFDVTDPYNPTLLRTGAPSLRNVVQSKEVVAVEEKNSLKLYDAADFVNGLAPKKEFSGAQYRGLTADEATGRFFAFSYSSVPEISNAGSAPSQYNAPEVYLSVYEGTTAATYKETKHRLTSSLIVGTSGNRLGEARSPFIPGADINSLDYHNGYFIAYGRPATKLGVLVQSDLRMWVFRNGAPVEIDTKSFIQTYYGGKWNKDGTFIDSALVQDLSIHTLNSKDYLFVGTNRFGDVYELDTVSGSTTTTPSTGTPPVVPPVSNPLPPAAPSGDQCIDQYRNLCDQIQVLKARLCALIPTSSYCSTR